MSNVTRRQLLAFFGASAATTVIAPKVGEQLLGNDLSVAEAAVETPLSFTPVRLPHALPIYQVKNSFLATGLSGQGRRLRASRNTALQSYTALDDVVVPPEYERYVIVRWGDRVFPDSNDYFGYNCDFTAFIPTNADGSSGYLWVNHESNSFPISNLAPGAPPDLAGFPSSGPQVIGSSFPTTRGRDLLGEFMYNMGGSILRIVKNRAGRYRVEQGRPINRRIHGLSGLGINSQRTDGYQTVISWNGRQGDNNFLIGTGAASTEVFPLSSDRLGNRIIGTGFNCSGGVTPWGTVFSAEENFQGSSAFFVGVQEGVKPDGTQTGYITGTTGAEFGLVGEKYGWMVELDPGDPSFQPRKHTALGRFRHENIAFRVEAGKRLIAYMGDDRRGGHTWKFVSSGTVNSPNRKGNSRLLEAGTLYVARYNPDGTGEWIPLTLDTPTNPIPPSTLASVEVSALGTATRNANTRLPRRNGIAGQTTDGGSVTIGINTTTNPAVIGESQALPGYQGKTLRNFYTSQGAILVDAFLAANLVGGTPTARPEDVEVHPINKQVYIAYTDGAPGSDGYPDSRIFVVSKYSSAVNETQNSGGIYRIIENSADGTGTTFRWRRFAQAGEAGAENGTGFGNVDNLVFDAQANIWCVTDISTDQHHGFSVGANPEQKTIDHTTTGDPDLVGVFGNNFLFFIPTRGPDAGELIPFAYGPPRCEMTGPTFAGDTLIIAVQHPGEDVPIGDSTQLSRTIELLDLNGGLFNQQRTVSRGSNWPSNIEGNLTGPPKPSVIGIRRREPEDGRFI
jgi:hypothetical protein